MAREIPAQYLQTLLRTERRPSWPVALATALLPLAGVLLLDWPVAAVIGVYWLDNVLIGLFHARKMFAAQGRLLDPDYEDTLRGNAQWSEAEKETLVANAKAVQHHVLPWFFLLHYGAFCLVHGIFVGVLFDGAFGSFTTAIGLATIVVMLFQHAQDLRAFRADPELVAMPRALLMFQPYGRIFALHIALLFGMVPVALGQPILAAVLLAAVKLWVDRSQSVSVTTLLKRKGRA